MEYLSTRKIFQTEIWVSRGFISYLVCCVVSVKMTFQNPNNTRRNMTARYRILLPHSSRSRCTLSMNLTVRHRLHKSRTVITILKQFYQVHTHKPTFLIRIQGWQMCVHNSYAVLPAQNRMLVKQCQVSLFSAVLKYALIAFVFDIPPFKTTQGHFCARGTSTIC